MVFGGCIKAWFNSCGQRSTEPVSGGEYRVVLRGVPLLPGAYYRVIRTRMRTPVNNTQNLTRHESVCQIDTCKTYVYYIRTMYSVIIRFFVSHISSLLLSVCTRGPPMCPLLHLPVIGFLSLDKKEKNASSFSLSLSHTHTHTHTEREGDSKAIP